jgi:transcriptional regulator with XRE-family HTH domain
MTDLAANVRRLMARCDMTLDDVVVATGLNQRTIKALLSGKNKPHARTLHRLAAGLDVSTDEFFQNPSLLTHRLFDKYTNPAVDEVVADEPQLFAGWTQGDFEELYSRFGAGGGLTAEGARAAVTAVNQKRAVHFKVSLLLESGQRELLVGLVDLLYQKTIVSQV